MQVLDSRRLTGANLLSERPSAVADITFDAHEDAQALILAWRKALERILERFDLAASEPFVRHYRGGASMGFDAPIDQLYAATDMNEWALEAAQASLSGKPMPDWDQAVHTISRALRDEANQGVLHLKEQAQHQDCPFLWDDDHVSLGYGAFGQVWEAQHPPAPDEVNWSQLRAVPVALITGTNGKTTTSRMLTRILKTAGYKVGSTSTDGVCVDETMVESGDWTGTGAARMVLRRQDVTAAVLETARGGLLRRGLAVNRCDVAVVTNVAADHLGDYGIDDVAAMAEVKTLVCAAVHAQGSRVINADDPHLVALLERYDSPLILYSTDPDNATVRAHCEAGGEAWFLVNGHIVQRCGQGHHEVLDGSQIPCTLGGAALHNLSNALAAAAAAKAMGVPLPLIAQALLGFGAHAQDNPGRCQLLEVDGFRLMLDFGHNAHGLQAMLELARRIMGQGHLRRLCVSLGQAGDRSDDEIRSLAEALHGMGVDRVILRRLSGYERGRQPGEVAAMLAEHLVELGVSSSAVSVCTGEIDALDQARAWARPGDLVMLLVHLEREPVAQWLRQHGATSA